MISTQPVIAITTMQHIVAIIPPNRIIAFATIQIVIAVVAA